VKNHVHRILRKTGGNRSNRDRGTLPTGEMAHPSPTHPLHCEALPRAEAAETR
jgi:hypothetical protein